MNLLNFNDSMIILVIKYPTLFWSKSEGGIIRKISDHTFNVIGNGYDELKDLEIFEDNEKNRQLLEDKRYDFLFSGEQIYEVLTVGENWLEDTFDGIDLNNGSERLNVNIVVKRDNEKRDKEKFLYSKIHGNEQSLYPNFKKEYSFFYKMKNNGLLRLFDITWLDAMIDFYESAKFEINGKGKYRGKPSDDNDLEWMKIKNNYQNQINKLKIDKTDDEWLREVSKHYSQKFDGDLEKFLEKRWQKEKERINKSISEILDDIRLEIATREVNEKKERIKP